MSRVDSRTAWLEQRAALEHPGRHLLGRFAAHELDGAALATVTAHVEGCAACRAALQDVEADRRAFLVRHPTSTFLASMSARRPWWTRLRRPVMWGGLLATAALALLLVRPSTAPTAPIAPTPSTASGLSTTRVKSGVGLSFHVRAGEVVSRGVAGGVYHPSDAIQLRYTSPGPRHLVVVSVDAAGVITPFYDADGRSLSVAPGVSRLLDGSVVLDETLGAERVVGCFAEAPISTGVVVDAARRALREAGGDPRAMTALALPCAQATFFIEKRAR